MSWVFRYPDMPILTNDFEETTSATLENTMDDAMVPAIIIDVILVMACFIMLAIKFKIDSTTDPAVFRNFDHGLPLSNPTQDRLVPLSKVCSSPQEECEPRTQSGHHGINLTARVEDQGSKSAEDAAGTTISEPRAVHPYQSPTKDCGSYTVHTNCP
ncbi:hypothetical protein N656DRAFT_799049 [Canariomyces notabilis]|uniref:Uncharacterized protein n=1 Tax=Canariomyces notabilis TaxID=2074819 RepID=A0AAN6YQI6_9PEZI|nr:hypothetical protein N656DRAFT_799049 [Canariomyces arenarius]